MTDSPEMESYSYEGSLPEGSQDHGFRIERQQEVQHELPLGEVFNDYDAAIQQAKDDLNSRLETGDGVTITASKDKQEEKDGVNRLYVEDATGKGETGALKEGIDNTLDYWIEDLYESAAFDYSELERVIQFGTQDKMNPELLEDIKKAFPNFPSEDIDPRTLFSQVTDAYAFESWGESVNLYNFSKTPISDEKLAEVANAIRAVGQVSGGKVFNFLSNIVIVPKGHPILMHPTEINTKPVKDIHITGARTLPGHVFLNSDFLLKLIPDSQPDLTELPVIDDTVPYSGTERLAKGIAEKVLGRPTHHQARVAGDRQKHVLEKAETDYAAALETLPRNSGPMTLESTLDHELHHILEYINSGQPRDAFKEKIGEPGNRGDIGFELPPSQYGNSRTERLPEVGRASFEGRGWGKLVGPRHQQAYASFLQGVHSKREGPTFVTCRELDLKALFDQPPQLRMPVEIVVTPKTGFGNT
jgi:hypothetical protein